MSEYDIQTLGGTDTLVNPEVTLDALGIVVSDVYEGPRSLPMELNLCLLLTDSTFS